MKAPARIVRTAILISLLAYVIPACDAFGQNQEPTIEPPHPRPKYEPRPTAGPDSLGSTLRLPSESKAAYLSLASTLIPVAVGLQLADPSKSSGALGLGLIGYGVIIGPSTGYFYGRCANRGLDGITVRVLTGAVAGVAVLAISSRHSGFDGLDQMFSVIPPFAAIITLEALYDLGRVSSTVRQRNEKVLKPTVSVGPSVLPDGKALGLKLAISF